MIQKTLMSKAQLQKRQKFIIVMIILLILLVVTFFISMNTGASKLSPFEVFQTLLRQGTNRQNLVLFEFRLPRIVISVLVGIGLAISGCILQSISRNALAEPGILGINSGAGLGVMLFISFVPAGALELSLFLPLFAFCGALITAGIIYAFSYKRGEGISPTRLILTGIAIAAGINAAMIVLTLRLTPENYQSIAVWMAGNIGISSWKNVVALLPWLIILLPIVLLKTRVLNVLDLGDQHAIGLGTSIERERLFLLGSAVALAGASVSVSGSISFVG